MKYTRILYNRNTINSITSNNIFIDPHFDGLEAIKNNKNRNNGFLPQELNRKGLWKEKTEMPNVANLYQMQTYFTHKSKFNKKKYYVSIVTND